MVGALRSERRAVSDRYTRAVSSEYAAVPVGGYLVQRPRRADGGVEDEQVGDQVVVLDHLALLVALGRGCQPGAAEGDPLGVAVEQLALVW